MFSRWRVLTSKSWGYLYRGRGYGAAPHFSANWLPRQPDPPLTSTGKIAILKCACLPALLDSTHRQLWSFAFKRRRSRKRWVTEASVCASRWFWYFFMLVSGNKNVVSTIKVWYQTSRKKELKNHHVIIPKKIRYIVRWSYIIARSSCGTKTFFSFSTLPSAALQLPLLAKMECWLAATRLF